MRTLQEYRASKDLFFAEHPHSPLTPEQQRAFRGLAYFDENPGLRFELALEPAPVGGQVLIETSNGGAQSYERHGVVAFAVEGVPARLTVFSNHNGFFVPFVDALAGLETYPAGRYLEPEPLPGDRLLVDFNLAYNPYCAYNELWSCPLTPQENRLPVAIRAGEKLFPD